MLARQKAKSTKNKGALAVTETFANRQAADLKRKAAIPSASDNELSFPAKKGKYKAKLIEHKDDEKEAEEKEQHQYTDPRRSIKFTDSSVCTLLFFLIYFNEKSIQFTDGRNVGVKWEKWISGRSKS